jgi:hypothetical protein
MNLSTRRRFLQTVGASVALTTTRNRLLQAASGSQANGSQANGMRIGLVTYLWGQNWNLPTLLSNCQQSQVLGLELRTQHAHGVEPSLNKSAVHGVETFEHKPLKIRFF